MKTTVVDCKLIRIGGDLGFCPVCDPEGKHPILFEARRNCRPGGKEKRVPIPEPPRDGPGTELKKLLGKLGIDASETGCKCSQRATRMNREGAKWCRENIGEILDWLKEEAERRKLLFVRFLARFIVLLAIRRAERKERR